MKLGDVYDPTDEWENPQDAVDGDPAGLTSAMESYDRDELLDELEAERRRYAQKSNSAAKDGDTEAANDYDAAADGVAFALDNLDAGDTPREVRSKIEGKQAKAEADKADADSMEELASIRGWARGLDAAHDHVTDWLPHEP
jgi:hypothetical protein